MTTIDGEAKLTGPPGTPARRPAAPRTPRPGIRRAR